jgi:hypothetical protein
MSFDKLIYNSLKSIKTFNKFIKISGGNAIEETDENRIASEANKIKEEITKNEANKKAEDDANKKKKDDEENSKRVEIKKEQDDIKNEQIEKEKVDKENKEEEKKNKENEEKAKQDEIKNNQKEAENIRLEKIKADKEATEEARLKKEDDDFTSEENIRIENEKIENEKKNATNEKLKKDQEIANINQRKIIEKRLETTDLINIEILKNVSLNNLYNDINKYLNDKNIEGDDKNIIRILSTFEGLPYKKHPYPELIDNNLIGGAIKINSIKSLFDLPNQWLREHQKMYRDVNLLKLVSLNTETIKNISLFYNDRRLSKLLVLILFWDAQELIKKCKDLSKGLNDMYDLNGLDDNNIKNNNKVIFKLVDFSDSDTGKTAKFVLTEDLINYYKSYSDKYNEGGIEEFDFNDSYIFSLLIQDYTHWKQTESNFNKLKKKLLEISNDIDYEYNQLNEEPVKTYLKIRNDNQKDKKYNELYNVYTNENLQSLYITNSNSKSEFLYGPFTKLFLPDDTNPNCQEILNSLMKEQKSVFLFGYGQVNSGKTSNLVFNNYTKQNGILLELLKHKDLAITEIEVTIKELYSHKKIGDRPQLSTNSYDKIKFRRKNALEEFILDDSSNNNQSGHYYQNKKECEWKIINGVFYHSNNSRDLNAEFLGLNGLPNKNIYQIRLLNEFIIYLINNKITKKSHQLMFFKMNYLSSNVYLILGDLVGVDSSDEFINNSLFGMNKEIAEITKKSSRELALFQKIPIFNSPCLEYSCNTELYNCFKLDKTNKINDDSIFKTINKVIGKKDDLIIAVYGIINISTNVNNPPKTEYIDLTSLKLIRETLYTNKRFNNDNNIIAENVKKIISILNLKEIKEINGIEDKKNELEKAELFNKYNLLVEIIQILEEHNSTTLLGTLDYLNYMKNSLQTDISCNIKDLEKIKRKSAVEKINLSNFKNVVNGIDILENQKGGSNNYKQSLIKEYKQLVKQYKNL